MRNLIYISIFLSACGSVGHVENTSVATVAGTSSDIDTSAFIERHNYYREKLGVPAIHWDQTLADYAQSWANKLAARCDLIHSNGRYGENIFWTSDVATEQEVVDSWAEEAVDFNHNNPVYSESKGYKYGHYSQIIWAKSLWLGAGMAECKGGGQIWVCSYNPAGNIVGEKAY